MRAAMPRRRRRQPLLVDDRAAAADLELVRRMGMAVDLGEAEAVDQPLHVVMIVVHQLRALVEGECRREDAADAAGAAADRAARLVEGRADIGAAQAIQRGQAGQPAADDRDAGRGF